MRSHRIDKQWDALVVGGGAAGVFAALGAKELSCELKIAILEASPKALRKVAISGGGRCNVTHRCDDLDLLLSCYPRGGPRLRAILSRFMPEDTAAWFKTRGVELKTEADGRMFPTSNRSETIVDLLLEEIKKLGIPLFTGCRVKEVQHSESEGFLLHTGQGSFRCRRLLLSTGGGSRAPAWLKTMGHSIVPDIPSLFTFCCEDAILQGLPGLSVDPVHLSLETTPRFEQRGPLLITHWGLSGPAILKLSAFAARVLAERDYRATLLCDWLPSLAWSDFLDHLKKGELLTRRLGTSPFPNLPKRLWQKFLEQNQLSPERTYRSLNLDEVKSLTDSVKGCQLEIVGKGVFKEEFVTSGGLPLREVSVHTMESRRVPGLLVAGELLDVDGITGGFNFQSAWATGHLASFGLVG